MLLQGATGKTLQYANDYLTVFSLYGIITVASGALPFLIRNDDSPIVATAMMVVGALTNVVLDCVFIGTSKLGIKRRGMGNGDSANCDRGNGTCTLDVALFLPRCIQTHIAI